MNIKHEKWQVHLFVRKKTLAASRAMVDRLAEEPAVREPLLLLLLLLSFSWFCDRCPLRFTVCIASVGSGGGGGGDGGGGVCCCCCCF